MKFRYKIMTINIMLLSVVFCFFGFVFIGQNMSMILKNRIDNAIYENNLIQANVEYQLLVSTEKRYTPISDVFIHFNDDLMKSFPENQLDLFILYNNLVQYKSTKNNVTIPEKLLSEMENGKKKYILQKEEDRYYIYMSSCTDLRNNILCVVTRNDITDAYRQIFGQLTFYRNFLLAILILACIFLFIFSYYITKPLESLIKISSSFGKGNYSARAEVTTTDEIGILADTYNQMAISVENHVEELESMIQRQDQFIADFSHEVKTPMTSIIGYSDMLRSKEMSRENQITAASYIFSEGKRLEAMSQKLFDFIYTKQHEIEKNPIHTEQLMNDVKQSIFHSLEQKGILLSFSCEDTVIMGDEQLLKSAFINLIDNARKASESGTTITFSGSKTPSGYCISVKDQGIGIPPEHLNRITDEFYMVDKSRSRSEGGAGLGLSLAALIFKCHEALFNISSKVNVGTTITITFREVDHEA